MMMSLDNAIWLADIVTEAAVVGLLLYKRVWRLLPLFCIYCGWDLLSNAGGFVSSQFFPASYNFTTYLVQTAVDTVLQFAVLIELAWSILRPIRASLPRGALVAISLLVMGLGAAIWPFAAVPQLAHLNWEGYLFVRLEQTVSILRIFFFLVLAGGSQWLSIGWRDRELQVATGLGFYSLASLGAAMLHAHQTTAAEYAHLNQALIASYIVSMMYWVFSFSQKEAQRREFTPQMQNLLLAVAGVARADRAALANSSGADRQRRPNP